MQYTFKLKGGEQIIATSPDDFLHQLHIGSRFDNQGTDTEFMHRFARRLQEQEGYLVRTDSTHNFIQDLLRHGFIKRKC